jgi:hypothetical protein
MVIWKAFIGNSWLHVKATKHLVENLAHESYIKEGKKCTQGTNGKKNIYNSSQFSHSSFFD